MKKIVIARENIKEQEWLLKCPRCGGAFRLDGGSVRCLENHCYDLAAKGYINFLGGLQTEYPRELFLSRREVFRAGFFEPICRKIVEFMDVVDGTEKAFVLDAGCGEGSALAYVVRELNQEKRFFGIGLDISKDAVAMATDALQDLMWIVGDLANVPLVDGSMDCVLNILSPANYFEFRRLLKKGGFLIKVVPADFHLKELRSFFYGEEKYDGSKTWEHTTKNVNIVLQERLTYTVPVDFELLDHFVTMTPLSRHVDERKKEELFGLGVTGITCDVVVLAGL